MELLDYLQWRNDVPLSVSPFNEVDNIILAYFILILENYGRNGKDFVI